jgi:hypothetical protein
VKPESHFDVLAIVDAVTTHVGSVSRGEVHMFAYLGCLMSLYRQRPAAEWGYVFGVTSHSYPYSGELDRAVDELYGGGVLAFDDTADAPTLVMTSHGQQRWSMLRSLTQYEDRGKVLDAVCASVLALPLGRIRHAVSNDPEIATAATLKHDRLLMTEDFIPLLHQQFDALARSIGRTDVDLFVPAVIWLSCLSEDESSISEGQV